MKVALSALLLLAAPLAAQEVFVHVIPPGCISVTVPATPTVAGKVTITCPPLKITTPITMPPAVAKQPYSGNVAALAKPTGGVPPYSYKLDPTPTPPAWMSMSTAGVIAGTPQLSGTFNFSFTVSDSSATLAQVGQGSLDVKKHGSPHAVAENQRWGVWIGGKFYETSDCPATGCVMESFNAR